MITPNTVVGGRYRVVRVLGGGGMKLVYLAQDLRLSARPCALAEMVDTFTSPEAQQNAIASFEREADMLARLSNEHIPRVIDRFSEANHHYLVMEYIDGLTLEDELKNQGGKLAADLVVDVAIQILETLEYLHGLTPPVIYRDLKPSNVMITPEGRAKLIDFGIARFFAPLSNATMIGTQGYAPPEQYRGKVETRSDLYALGATMHHALSGRDPAAEPPFSFPQLRKIAPDIDSGLAALVDQALAYDVSRRVADASDFKRRLIELRQPLANASGTAATNASAIGAAISQPTSSTAKTQLQLPLGNDANNDGTAAAPSSAPPPSSAPTVITANPEIRCPRCTRRIPANSRFCSYCAEELVASSIAGSRHSDATVILSPADRAKPDFSFGQPSPPKRERRSAHRPFLFVLLIVLAAFLVMRIARVVTSDVTPPSYGTDRPDNPGPPGPDSIAPMLRFRLIALRQALDASGYATVRIGLHGNSLILSGTIPSEQDRETVQQLCWMLQFPYYHDNLRVASPTG